jgi:phosphodiesterase/alkaline phosphatase D-like protein
MQQEKVFRNDVRKYIINAQSKTAWNIIYLSTIMNMASLRNFEVTADKIKVMEACNGGNMQRS